VARLVDSVQGHITRRKAVAVLGLGTVGLFLSACGGGSAGAPAAPTKPAAAAGGTPGAEPTPQVYKSKGTKGTVSYWHNHTGIGLDSRQKMWDKFTAETGIGVEATYVPTTAGTQMSEKLLAAIAGGTPPDTAYFDRFIVASWANKGSLTDITSNAQKDGITSDLYFNFAWQEANLRGKLFALPNGTDTRGLWWNKDHFTEAGLDPEKPPTNVTELAAMADKLTKKDGGKLTRLGFSPYVAQSHFYGWGWMFGGEFYDDKTGKFNAGDDHNVHAGDWYIGWAKKYDIAQIDSFGQSFGVNAQDPFIAGLVSMKVDGNWIVPSLQKYAPNGHFGAATIPVAPGDNDKVSTWAGGWSMVLPKGVKQQDLGWQFIKHQNSPENMVAYAKSGDSFFMPTAKKATEDPFYQTLGPQWKIFMDLLPTARWRPVIPEGQLAWTELGDAGDQMRHQKKPVKQALDDVTAKVNDALTKDKWSGA
jgi:multiple sugar transport system substrate-binding protein